MPKELKSGENRAVDLAVVAGDRLLLIRRGDGGGWAIPGGFVEPGESDVDAMVRELREETGVTAGIVDVLTVRFVVPDPRNRRDRWITTVLGLARFEAPPHALAADDAADARWVRLASFDDIDGALRTETGVGLYPAHRPLVDEVVKAVRS